MDQFKRHLANTRLFGRIVNKRLSQHLKHLYEAQIRHAPMLLFMLFFFASLAIFAADTVHGEYCTVYGGSTEWERISDVGYRLLPDKLDPHNLGVAADVFITNPGGCTYAEPCPEYDSYPEAVSVWVDWNGDEIFSADEIVLSESLTGYQDINYWGVMTAAGIARIPDHAVNRTLMRTSLAWKHEPADPCEPNWEYGNSIDTQIDIKRPDLVIENMTFLASDPLKPWKLDRMYAVISNRGEIGAEDIDVDMARMIAANTGLIELPLFGREHKTIPALSPGEIHTVVFEGDFDPMHMSLVEVEVDRNRKIRESDESNNIKQTRRIAGRVSDSSGHMRNYLGRAKVSLYQEGGEGNLLRWVTFTDLEGNYNIWPEIGTIRLGVETTVNASLEFSPYSDPSDIRIRIINDTEWGKRTAADPGAKPASKGVLVDPFLKDQDYLNLDIDFLKGEGGTAFDALSSTYWYFKASPVYFDLARRLDVEIFDKDFRGHTSYMDARGTHTLHMWHEQCRNETELRDIIAHEYSHAVSSPWNMPYGPTGHNGVRKEDGLDENWANYGSCLSRGDWRSTVGPGAFANYRTELINMTKYKIEIGGMKQSIDAWPWAMGDAWYDIDHSRTENKVVYSLKFGQPKSVKMFYMSYLAYQMLHGEAMSNSTKNSFIMHGFVNATAWIPGGTDPKYFPGGYSDVPLDPDSDGDYDSLAIRMDVNVTDSGSYYLYGFLKDSTGEGYCYSVKRLTLPAGISSAELEFEGKCISENRLSGSLRLEGLYIADGSHEQLDFRLSPYSTSPVDPDDFQSGAFALLNFTDYGIDDDGDGRFDSLRIDAAVEVNDAGAPGAYAVSAGLYGTDGSYLGDYSGTVSLAPGSQIVPLLFSGSSIRHLALDGPYEVRGFSVTLPEFTLKGQTLFHYPKAYRTRAYSYLDFKEPEADLGAVSHIEIDSDSDGLIDKVMVTAEVDVGSGSAGGSYSLRGVLSNGSVGIADYANSTWLSPGSHNLSLLFDARTIRRNRIPGPYLVHLELEEARMNSSPAMAASMSVIDEKDITLDYNISDLEIPEEGDYGFSWNASALDADNNSLYDALVIQGQPADGASLSPGLALEGYLYGMGGDLISVASSSGPSLMFSSQDIYASGTDGPYRVDIVAYENGSRTAEIHEAYVTSAWNSSLFEGVRISSVSDFGATEAGPGLFNYLGMNVRIESNVRRNVSFAAVLHEPSGKPVAGGLIIRSSISGRHEEPSLSYVAETGSFDNLSLYFKGYSLYINGYDGPYDATIELYADGVQAQDAIQRIGYRTAEYDHDDFEHLVSFLGGPGGAAGDDAKEYAVDIDEDGFYDVLAVNLSLRIEAPGHIVLDAALEDASGDLIDRYHRKIWMPAGNRTVQVLFNGSRIREHGVSGEYNVTGLYIYHTGDSSLFVYESSLLRTRHYDALSFNYSALSPGRFFNIPPVAVANGPYYGSAGEEIAFDSSGSVDPDGGSLAYFWDFGDSMNSSAANPSHSYSSEGLFNATLWVNDGFAGSPPSTALVSVGYPLADGNGPYFSGVGQAIVFNATGSLDPEGSNLTYYWDFGDGFSAHGQMPVHLYEGAGKYRVRLIVNDGAYNSSPYITFATVEKQVFFESIADYTSDPDNDGLYDALSVRANITSYIEGDANLSVALLDSFGSVIQSAAMAYHLDKGYYGLAVEFNGTAIYLSGADGPYRIIFALESLNRTLLDAKNHTTLPYSHSLFEHAILDHYTVDDDDSHVPVPPADFDSIQEAIDSVPAGSRILVYYGIYPGGIQINRTVDIRGVQMPIIDAMWSGTGINISADGCAVSGFRVRNAQGGVPGLYDAAVSVWGSRNNVSGIIAESSEVGINIDASGDENLISGNRVMDDEIGIRIHKGSRNRIISNNITGQVLAGIMLEASSGNAIRGNLVRDSQSVGVSLRNSSMNTLSWNILENSNNAEDDGLNSWSSGPEEYEYDGRSFMNYTGNFWSSYHGVDLNNDGIYDSAYSLAGAEDLFPMVPSWQGGFRPVADGGGPYSGESGQDILFDASRSFDPEGSDLAYFWTFGDGSEGRGVRLNHSYATGGNYQVGLIVSDGIENSTEYITSALVDYPVARAGGPYYGKEGDNIRFNASGSYDPLGRQILGYYWDFGDGTFIVGSSGPRPFHRYQVSGNYSVSLYITVKGPFAWFPVFSPEDYTTAYVSDSDPVAGFAVDKDFGAAPLEVAFTDTSSSYDGIVLYEWDFDNDSITDLSGSNSSNADLTNPHHVYDSPGDYSPALTVHEADGDMSTYILPHTIKVLPSREPRAVYVPDNFSTVQDAIDDNRTLDGDRIVLRDGIYNQSLEVHKSVAIIGEHGYESCMITGDRRDNIITVSADGVIIRGCTITGADSDHAGVFLDHVNRTELLWNNISANGRGVLGRHSAFGRIAWNLFTGNVHEAVHIEGSSILNPGRGFEIIDNELVGNPHMGLYLLDVDASVVKKNKVLRGGGTGIFVRGDNNTIRENIASHNNGQGILIRGSYNRIMNNTALNNTYYGIELTSPSASDIAKRNYVTGNILQENHMYDLYLGSDAGISPNNLIEDNTGSGGRRICFYNESVRLGGIMCSELILYKADGSRITDARIAGSDSIRNNAFFMYDTHYSNLTRVISSDNHYGIIYIGYTYPSSVPSYHWANNTITDSKFDRNYYNGMVIRGKGNLIDGCDSSSNGRVSDQGIRYGNGIEIAGRLNLVRDSMIRNNTATGIRFGMLWDPYRAMQNTFEGNRIISNHLGVSSSESSWNALIGNTIANSTFDGLAMGNSNAWLILNNTIEGNPRYGISAAYCRNLSIRGNSFIRNRRALDLYGSSAEIGSSGVLAAENLFFNNTLGMRLLGTEGIMTEDVNITGNRFRENAVGISLEWETRNISLSANRFEANGIGLQLREIPPYIRRGAALCAKEVCSYSPPSCRAENNIFNDTVALLFNSSAADNLSWFPETPKHVRLPSQSIFRDNLFLMTEASFRYNWTGSMSISPVRSPSEAPEGYIALGSYLDVKNLSAGTWLSFDVSLRYDDSSVSGLNESSIAVMLDGPWHKEPMNSEDHDAGKNMMNYSMIRFGVLGLFARRPAMPGSSPYFVQVPRNYTLYLMPPGDLVLANDISGSMSADYMQLNHTRYHGYLLYNRTSVSLGPGQAKAVTISLEEGIDYDDVGISVRGDSCMEFAVMPPGGVYSGFYPAGRLYHYDEDGSFSPAGSPGGGWNVMVSASACQEAGSYDIEFYTSIIDSVKVSGERYIENNLISARRIGIVDFASDAHVGVMPTDDSQELKDHVLKYDATGDTCICCAINEIAENLNSSAEVVLLSDGEALRGCVEQGVTPDLNGNGISNDPGDDAVQAACDAFSSHGIRISTVGLGRRVDMTTLVEVAGCSQGEFYYARDSAELESLMENLVPRVAPIRLNIDLNCTDDDGDAITYYLDGEEIADGIVSLWYNTSVQETRHAACSDGRTNATADILITVV